MWWLERQVRRWRQMKTLKAFGRTSTASAAQLKVSLVDSELSVAEALASRFADLADVEVLCGDLFLLSCDVIVSPANSFGDMSGGLDKVIDDFYAGQAQSQAMAAIREQYWEELPVGAALLLHLGTSRFPYLVVAPTMRLPGNIIGTLNVYLAFRAALRTVLQSPAYQQAKIKTLAASGLGTGVGGMPATTAADQMRAAYDQIVASQWQAVIHPLQAPFALHQIIKWNR